MGEDLFFATRSNSNHPTLIVRRPNTMHRLVGYRLGRRFPVSFSVAEVWLKTNGGCYIATFLFFFFFFFHKSVGYFGMRTES